MAPEEKKIQQKNYAQLKNLQFIEETDTDVFKNHFDQIEFLFHIISVSDFDF